jgi:hypothetical protein
MVPGMARMTDDGLGGDAEIGTAHGGSVEIRKLPDGRAVLLPASLGGRRLGAEGVEVLADIEDEFRAIAAARGRIDGLVVEARQYGVPWSLIGFVLGLSDQGARKRFWKG